MNLVEQLALGGICLARALRASVRSGPWRAWWPVAAALAAVVAALAWAAHPALSWVMAPVLRAVAGEGALRFPQALAKLATLSARGELVVWLLVGLPCSGAATRAFAAVFGQPVARPRSAAGEALALVLAGLPAVLVAFGVQAALGALEGVRLSGFTRQVLPPLGALVVLFARATTFYVVAEVVLGGNGPLGALAAIRRTFGNGFVPAVLVLLALGLPFAVLGRLEPLAAAGRWHDLPEAAVPLAFAHALLRAWALLAATGAATLAWMSTFAEPEALP